MIDQSQTQSQPSGTQEKILQIAQEEPELTNADIAERTGSLLATVRDTLIKYDEPTKPSETPLSEVSKPVDSASFNQTESAVLEHALRNPDATNADIAATVNTHVGLVRDIRDDYESVATISDEELSTNGLEGVHPDSSTVAGDDLSEIEQQILESATDHPDYSIADIASDVDARIPFVRDTLSTYQE
jgi:hypothetical protein